MAYLKLVCNYMGYWGYYNEEDDDNELNWVILEIKRFNNIGIFSANKRVFI